VGKNNEKRRYQRGAAGWRSAMYRNINRLKTKSDAQQAT